MTAEHTERLLSDKSPEMRRADAAYVEILSRLTAKGAPFELVSAPEGRLFAHAPATLAPLFAQISTYGDRDCIVYGDERISYVRFADRALRLAGGLGRLGRVGDRVAILGANHPDWLGAFWAAILSGMIPVALNGWWRAEELRHGLELSGARILIGDRRRVGKFSANNEIDGPEAVFLWDSDEAASDPGTAPLASLPDEPLSCPPELDPAHPAALFFTSGTTGRAKAAVVSHRAWITAGFNAALAGAVELERAPQINAADGRVRLLAGLPFFHVGGGHGVGVNAILGGQTIVIPKGKFEPDEVLRLIESERIDRWSAVPAMVQQVCTHGNPNGYDLSSLKTLGYGAAPSGRDLVRRAHDLFPGLGAVSNAYGLTEAGAIFAMNTGVDLALRPSSVGRPFANAEVRIVDGDERALPAGSLGEVQVRGPFLMTGYWNDPQATAAAISPEGWLRTGDLGRLDEDGFLHLEGRLKDIIIRGGENILAEEVERRIEAHPSVAEAAVVGVESDRLGEEVKAVVRLRSGDPLSAEALRDWVGDALAHFKVPRFVEFRVEPLPRNATGKVVKRALASADATQFDQFFR